MRSSFASTDPTISSRPVRALSDDVLIPVSAVRIACACFRHETASSATALTSAASTVSSRSRAIETRAAASL